ncbi:tlde1 domain-containing protein [Pantoea osteomyelitidis]|uniref:Tlde1 domain-containing protein n=1 Tax=Pantoea osteomyelitidis TaxID=3230026 RepID=A0ABW7PSJ3_9GAMM
MVWKYVVREATFYNNGIKLKARYAGAPGYYNNPSQECIKNKGPVPRGRYIIGAPYKSLRTGIYTLPLSPDAENNMCGRGDFLIHGDSIRYPGTASQGCIIAVYKVRKKFGIAATGS